MILRNTIYDWGNIMKLRSGFIWWTNENERVSGVLTNIQKKKHGNGYYGVIITDDGRMCFNISNEVQRDVFEPHIGSSIVIAPYNGVSGIRLIDELLPVKQGERNQLSLDEVLINALEEQVDDEQYINTTIHEWITEIDAEIQRLIKQKKILTLIQKEV